MTRQPEARSPRETIQSKAHRYLLEGRLRVLTADHRHAIAVVRGQGTTYQVEGRAPSAWRCSCPALRRCSHLIALQLVICFPPQTSRAA